MRPTLFTPLVCALGGLLVSVPVVVALEQATITFIEGTTSIQQVRDKSGQLITVEVPTQRSTDIKVSRVARQGAGQITGTVEATALSIQRQDNMMQVRTQEGQVLELATSSRALMDVRPGGTFTLLVPQ